MGDLDFDLVLSQTHCRPVKPSFSPASTVAPRHASQPIMSYADIAAKGPKQSPEEARAHPVPALEPSESESASLIDVDSPHVSSVKSDFQEQEVKTETQAERLEREAEDKARAEAQKASEAEEGWSEIERKQRQPSCRGQCLNMGYHCRRPGIRCLQEAQRGPIGLASCWNSGWVCWCLCHGRLLR